jgi:hypothetical protein
MKKGKSKNRSARRDILKENARNAARKARTTAIKARYDRQNYDGHGSEGAGGQDRYQ